MSTTDHDHPHGDHPHHDHPKAHGHDHEDAKGHGHTHGTIDVSISSSGRGLWALIQR